MEEKFIWFTKNLQIALQKLKRTPDDVRFVLKNILRESWGLLLI